MRTLNLFIILLIFSVGIKSQSTGQQLIDAAKSFNSQRIKTLVEQGADVNFTDENGASVLMWAVFKCDSAMVQYLVGKGADVNKKGVIYLDEQKTGYYGNLLCIAAGEGKPDVLKFLTEICKLDVNAQEWNPEEKALTGWTALQWACSVQGKSNTGEQDYLNNKDGSQEQFIANNTQIIEYLLANGANINFNKNQGQYTPLLLALGSQKWDIADMLIEKEADVSLKTSDSISALHLAAVFSRQNLIITLLKKKLDPNVQDTSGNTPIMYLAKDLNSSQELKINCLRLMFTAGGNLKIKNNQGLTAFDIATKANNTDIISFLQNPVFDYVCLALFGREEEILAYIQSDQFVCNQHYLQDYSLMDLAAIKDKPDWIDILIKKGENLDAPGFQGQTPLMNAADYNSIEAVKKLLELKADINYQTKEQEDNSINGWSAMHFAARKGNIKIIKLLVENGAKLNAQTYHGSSPLMIAALYDKISAVKLLYYLNANLTIRDLDNNTAMDLAKQEKNAEIMDFLSGPKITVFDKLKLGYNEDVLKDINTNKVNLNEQNNNGLTLLCYASYLGYEDVVKALLEKNANANMPDHQGDIAINYAIHEKYSEIVKLLLDKSNLKSVDKNGWTPLHFAVKKGYYYTRLLLEKGAKPNIQEEGGHSPAMLASIENSLFTLRLLYVYGADFNLKNKEGKTALELAKDSAVIEFMKKPYRCPFVLANAGFDAEAIKILKADTSLLNKKDLDNWTIRDNAIVGESLKLIQYLIDNKVDMYDNSLKWDKYYLTPLQYAIVKNYKGVSNLLIKNNIKTLATDSLDGDLSLSISFGRTEIVKCILGKRKINLNKQSENGSTMLFIAVKNNQLEMVKLLIDKGSNPRIKDNKSRTPLDIAKEKGYDEITKYLSKFQ